MHCQLELPNKAATPVDWLWHLIAQTMRLGSRYRPTADVEKCIPTPIKNKVGQFIFHRNMLDYKTWLNVKHKTFISLQPCEIEGWYQCTIHRK